MDHTIIGDVWPLRATDHVPSRPILHVPRSPIIRWNADHLWDQGRVCPAGIADPLPPYWLGATSSVIALVLRVNGGVVLGFRWQGRESGG